jgi:hypothetical protein
MHAGGFLAPESYGPNERLVVNAWATTGPSGLQTHRRTIWP